MGKGRFRPEWSLQGLPGAPISTNRGILSTASTRMGHPGGFRGPSVSQRIRGLATTPPRGPPPLRGGPFFQSVC